MTALRLYNTLTRTKEDFVPLNPSNVRMYVCGPTVYDFAHIGNARPAIVFDVLYRLLKHLYPGEGTAADGSRVTYVRNITDVDDKINARAAAEGITIRELTEKTYQIYNEDIAALGCLPPTVTPRATEHIQQMIAMIQTLIANGHAYEAQGHVLFDVSSKSDYGKLARRSLDDMIAGARVDVAPYKKGAMDFVLWKPSDENTPGWESPWGRGRPGWHIECSAMAGEYLGETFDIHGGGIDLVFPHHENEIAQSESAHHNHPLAKVWMHNGFLNVEGEKMSKSLGNFVTIRELWNGVEFGGRSWAGTTLRFSMLRTHYRQPIDWTLQSLSGAERTLQNWKRVMDAFPTDYNREDPPPSEFLNALYDDLNTPKAEAVMHQLAHKARDGDFEAAQSLHQAGRLLGFVWEEVLSASEDSSVNQAVARQREDSDIIEGKVEARNAARKAKNFKESDRIRDELMAQGIVLKDGPQGTTWEVKR